MHDCILAIFWPKKQILDFLLSVDCPLNILPPVDTQLSRHEIVIDAFSRLSARPDRGYAVFQTMIDRLSNWSYLDPYYFVKLAKLDSRDAQQKIDQLKKALEKRNATTESRRAASSETSRQRSKTQDLNALTTAFSKLYGTGLAPQARGRLFETFLRELFNRQSIHMRDNFRLTGEEIDGTFKFEGENYVVEAKWQEASVATSQLYHFAMKVDGKMHGRGLFISVNAFSNEAIRAIVHGKHIQTILMDGQDISHVPEQRISLEDMLDYKIRAAQTRGEIYVCAVLKSAKV
ncbi:hypothetical protein GCM10022268_27620 [Sphingomonas cynarae]|uniref:Restriction endonuclease type IV Mrr domain-containing protein n=2 Tax=Sphingomonas cynarae TaxID=930197 RepID=A0ABP7EDD3_9SPHN